MKFRFPNSAKIKGIHPEKIEISRGGGRRMHRRIAVDDDTKQFGGCVSIPELHEQAGREEFAKIQDGNAEQGGKIHLVISQAIMPWRRAGWVTLI